jgi:hypothetical protein
MVTLEQCPKANVSFVRMTASLRHALAALLVADDAPVRRAGPVEVSVVVQEPQADGVPATAHMHRGRSLRRVGRDDARPVLREPVLAISPAPAGRA